ncbi:hypothetical protein IKG20_02975 [Candidatus Saccharibacteria bacterium]|nr:hypothetical protein [Candidatus Saccharibacteria bacterium]
MEEKSSNMSQIDTALPSSENKREKQKNPFKIATIICAILALAGIGFGIYGFFFKKPSADEAINSLSQEDVAAIAVVSDAKELPATNNSENQEITITNPYILRDLNHKFAMLHGVSSRTDTKAESNQFLTTMWAYNYTSNLYATNNYSFLKDMAIVTASIAAEQQKSFYNGLSDIIKKYLDTANQNNGSPQASYEEIAKAGFATYEQANQAFHDLAGTGSDLPKEDGFHVCTHYQYISEADGFLQVPGGGCGGAGYGALMVRKDSLKAKGDEAYIYTHLLTTSGVDQESEPGKNICHVLDGWRTKENVDDVEERKELDKFETNSLWCSFPDDYATTHDSLFDQSQAYKFVFKKNSEGIYSFERVEKL